MAHEIRIGKISSVDAASGMVRVVYHDRDDDVTAPIPLLAQEYKLPQIGQQVLVLHLSNGSEAGVVLGAYWNQNNRPPESGEGLYRKELGDSAGEAFFRYDGKTLSIECSGDLEIKAAGAVRINGKTIDLN